MRCIPKIYRFGFATFMLVALLGIGIQHDKAAAQEDAHPAPVRCVENCEGYTLATTGNGAIVYQSENAPCEGSFIVEGGTVITTDHPISGTPNTQLVEENMATFGHCMVVAWSVLPTVQVELDELHDSGISGSSELIETMDGGTSIMVDLRLGAGYDAESLQRDNINVLLADGPCENRGAALHLFNANPIPTTKVVDQRLYDLGGKVLVVSTLQNVDLACGEIVRFGL